MTFNISAGPTTTNASHKSHQRTVHIPGSHALPPGVSNGMAWELGYARKRLDADTQQLEATLHPGMYHVRSEAESNRNGMEGREEEEEARRKHDEALVLAEELGDGVRTGGKLWKEEETGGSGSASIMTGDVKGLDQLNPYFMHLELLKKKYAPSQLITWSKSGRGTKDERFVPVGGWPSNVQFEMGVRYMPEISEAVFVMNPVSVQARVNDSSAMGSSTAPPRETKSEQLLREILQIPNAAHHAATTSMQPQKQVPQQQQLPPHLRVIELPPPPHMREFITPQAPEGQTYYQWHHHHAPTHVVVPVDAAFVLNQASVAGSAPRDSGVVFEEGDRDQVEGHQDEQDSCGEQDENKDPEEQEEDVQHTSDATVQASPPVAKDLPPSIPPSPPQPLDQQHQQDPSSIEPQPRPQQEFFHWHQHPHPHPPHFPLPSVTSVTPTNPLTLPIPYAYNRRYHSTRIHPDYLVDPRTGGPMPKGVVPQKYLETHNIACRVNGRPEAQQQPQQGGALHEQQIEAAWSTGRNVVPLTTSGVAGITGLGAIGFENRFGGAKNGVACPPPPSGRNGLPYLNERVAMQAAYGRYTTGTSPRSAGVRLTPLLFDGRSVARLTGMEERQYLQQEKVAEEKQREWEWRQQQHAWYHGVGDSMGSEEAERKWFELMQLSRPVGRRGWNSVGRDHLGHFEQGLAPVTNYYRGM
ncbi:hypothetical protein HDU98_011137 [Podochytrium sp. JEL0797]|nr:hypothetical protein HDU98_011137 [Podochytrium sp. JEL0797]